MEVTAYLNFNGTCAEAFKFYERVLGGTIGMMHTFGGSPMAADAPPGWGDRIMHVSMTIGNSVLMGSDAPTQNYEKPQGFAISAQVATPAEGERVFKALAEGGTVTMPFQSTFWSAGFGALVDRYGTPWMVNTDQATQG